VLKHDLPTRQRWILTNPYSYCKELLQLAPIIGMVAVDPKMVPFGETANKVNVTIDGVSRQSAAGENNLPTLSP
jgi:hypothetical protein